MMGKQYIKLNIYLIILVVTAGYVLRPKKYNNSTKFLNFTEQTFKNGYLSEEHNVVTEDGYILKIFRIIRGRRCFGKVRGPPVLLMHGLLQSSDAWLDAGPSAGLAYLISDSCFDVWVGNVRGNYYSRSHVHLKPDKDPDFWKFSTDEIGFYDVPAIIEYVLFSTGAPKLNYIGYSQGAGTFYIMCSERPGFCEKVHLMISLAPATRHYNTESILYRKFALSVVYAELFLRSLGIHEIFQKGDFSQAFLENFCPINRFTEMACIGGIGIFDSDHPMSITNDTNYLMFKHFPAGTSIKNIVRYGQSMTQKDFMKFDYGGEKNLGIYGSAVPPAYNLSAVTVPVVVLYGANDHLVSTKDVEWLVQKLPNVVDSSRVKDRQWNHFDVTYSQFVGVSIFPKIYKYLIKYSYL